MDLGLQGRVVLITGASKGIGRSTALCLAEEGCDIHLVARTESDLNAVADEIRSACNVHVNVIAMDLAERGNVDRLFDEIGNIDILVNNAGAHSARHH